MMRIEKEYFSLFFSLISPLQYNHTHSYKPPQPTKPSLSAPLHSGRSSEEPDIMDFHIDFRATIHSANGLSAPLHSDNYSVIPYTDVENDGQSFQCPFCDFEIQGTLLCNDLEDEYWSAQKNVVCPVCEENLGKDAITQFTHSSSRKWGWKSEKSSIWSGNSETLGKKSAARGNKQESIPDPLLSPFICNVPIPNRNSIHPDENSIPSNKDIDIHNAKRCSCGGGSTRARTEGSFCSKVDTIDHI